MSKVAWIGLGKLGLPCAVAMSQKGHKVYGYDVDKEKMDLYRQGIPETGSNEPNLREQLIDALTENLYLCDSLYEALTHEPKIVFIAVPTPSLPDNSFDTSYVESAVKELVDNFIKGTHHPIIAIVSTCLPTTMRERIKPIINGKTALIYNPYFIAMSTVREDFLYPEFVLIGGEDKEVMNVMEQFYRTIIPEETPILKMTWENAELGKMAYNTIIGFKIIIANTIMEICHNIPHADSDVITEIFRNATKRVVGDRYLRGGMGDSGLCHPRDGRALSWLANKLKLSANPFDFIMKTREKQSEWIASLLKNTDIPVVIMGKRFKAGSILTTDSTSILVADILKRKWGIESYFYDPMLDLIDLPDGPCIFLASLDEEWVNIYPYPSGSVVLDVWRRFTEEDIERLITNNVHYVPVGRNR